LRQDKEVRDASKENRVVERKCGGNQQVSLDMDNPLKEVILVFAIRLLRPSFPVITVIVKLSTYQTEIIVETR
jgi:hypothetical protein